ncbi:MAG: linear amide C-N hydrolase [Paludibacteraceae bacterium]|nr:linear amide C-N hydrolase [Paludibacteraceae bacterium]
MKKTYLALMAVAAIALTGCKESTDEPEPTPWGKYKLIDVRKNGVEFVQDCQLTPEIYALENSEKTLRSLRYVPQSKGRVYFMDYMVDFPWEKFIRDKDHRFAVNDFQSFNNDVNVEFFNGLHQSVGPYIDAPQGCSGFVCKNPSGELLFGRNLDGIPGSMVVLFNKNPRPGEYKSVMLTNIAYANRWDGTENLDPDSSLLNPEHKLDVMLRQNIAVMDGMNEYGLCFAAYQLPNSQDGTEEEFPGDTKRPISIDQQAEGKAQITLSVLHNRILSTCKTVEDVVELFNKYNYTTLLPKTIVHWFVADATNDYRVFEYWNRYDAASDTWKDTLYIMGENDHEFINQASLSAIPYERYGIENYYVNPEAYPTYYTDLWQRSMSSKMRAHKMMSAYKPVMTEEEALECLQEGNFGMGHPNQVTDWSCIYNPRKGTLVFNMRNELSEVYSINIKDELK